MSRNAKPRQDSSQIFHDCESLFSRSFFSSKGRPHFKKKRILQSIYII